ncbi:hypothetical protein ACLMAJ_04425 [Nocardia sp. KC 131]|uniref:hypothetical protein n=1 Tax=Nocardia arseniciresistens TaxID=3392119 RepID=UPI00398F0191
MIGKWFRRNAAKKLAEDVIPAAARATEKPIRQTAETLTEFVGKTVPDRDLEGRHQIEQSGFGGPPAGAPGSLDPSLRSSERKFKTTEMLEYYRGEHLPDNDLFPPKLAKYLTDEERKSYMLTIRDGKIYDANGRFDTTRSKNGKAIWVTDEKGTMYAASEEEGKNWRDWDDEDWEAFDGSLYHSSFFGGQPVSGAGELRAVDGELRMFSDKSGHYEPRQEYTQQVVDHLRDQGVEVDPSIVRTIAPN